MERSIDKLWEEALNLIKEEIEIISPISYKTWIAPLELLSFEGNEVILYTPRGEMQKEIVDQKFLELIKNALSLVMKKDVSVSTTLSEPSKEGKESTSERKFSHTKPYFNSKYTFETFVVGSSNIFAEAVCRSTAEQDNPPNPLFLYGNVGLGKTHLMHAIGNRIISLNPDANIMYITAEKFTNDYIYARGTTYEAFREKYRNIDVLMIDDIQFFGDKVRTEEEFFNTFNDLFLSNKKIILSADSPPARLFSFSERMRSRFSSGLIADIQPPDIETRIAILRKKAELEGYIVPDDVIYYIADKITNNIRELEGALTRVVSYSYILNSNNPISLEIAIPALEEIIASSQNKIVTTDLIKETVARYYDITVSDLNSSKRNKEIVFPRQIAIYLSKELTDFSFTKIGKDFNRDHSTVISACDKIKEEIRKDGETRNSVEEITRRITGK